MLYRLITILVLLLASPAWGVSHTVCASGCDYTRVYLAIDANNYELGDTLTISGTVTESTNVDFSIGNNDDGLIIQGAAGAIWNLGGGWIVLDGVDNITIKDLTITNTTWGISANSTANGFTLQNVLMSGSIGRPIFASGCQDWTLENVSIIGGTSHPISFTNQAGTNVLSNVSITDATAGAGYFGVYFYACTGTYALSTISITSSALTSAIRIYGGTAPVIGISGLTISGITEGHGLLADGDSAAAISGSDFNISCDWNPIYLNGFYGPVAISTATLAASYDGAIYLSGASLEQKSFSNITITTGTANGGINLLNSELASFTNFSISGVNGQGVLIDNSDDISFQIGAIANSTGDGFYTKNGCSRITANRVWVYGSGNTDDAASGDAFTSHDADSVILITNSVAHDNRGTALAFVGTSSGAVYNFTSVNNGGATSFGGGPSNRGGIYISTSGGSGWTIKNYIGQANYPYEIQLSAGAYSGLTATNNLYYHVGNGVTEAQFANVDSADKTWAEWVALGKETDNIYANPLLTSTYGLQSNSPAKDAGAVLYTYAAHPGDFYGRKVYGSGPDIGAVEFEDVSPGSWFFEFFSPPILNLCASTNAACYIQE